MAGAGKTKVLFVRNLNYDTTEETVKDKFVDCTDVRILTFADSGRSKGLGFIEFENADDAQRAYEDMQSCSIDDRQITLDYAEERNSGGPGKSKVLFVRNLNYDTSEDTIRDKFPDASDVRILTYPDGRSKGTGFIEFTNAEDAQKALEDYQGEVIDDREINLDYARERRSTGARGRSSSRRGYGGRDSWGGGGGRDGYSSYSRDSYSRGGGRRDYGGGGRDYGSSRDYGSRSGGYGGRGGGSRGGSSWGRGGGGRSGGWSDDYDYGN